MIACLPSLAGAAEDEEAEAEADEEDCEGGFALVCRMLSLYSSMCSNLTPLAMVIAFFKFTSPRNVSLMISRVWSSTSFCRTPSPTQTRRPTPF